MFYRARFVLASFYFSLFLLYCALDVQLSQAFFEACLTQQNQVYAQRCGNT